ncbi:Hypothetical predicted protein [Olea europaea subsp. europaea]|uniref:Uncharacterized protein n=1 Tax=Olea europaea subsp. europaea TaxID=158383 RepID=A0A8S0QYZ9_OLEEU|nr:Hypothetical predicted protein [Olea europaea subsp. europaea]
MVLEGRKQYKQLRLVLEFEPRIPAILRTQMTFCAALNLTLDEEMSADSNVVLMGE